VANCTISPTHWISPSPAAGLRPASLCDFEDVPEAVVVETAHCGEVRGESFDVACLQLLDEELYVGGDDFLGRLRLEVEGRVLTLLVSFVVAMVLMGGNPLRADRDILNNYATFIVILGFIHKSNPLQIETRSFLSFAARI
jgi:hypothetical protein